jgi:hypothetical protein
MARRNSESWWPRHLRPSHWIRHSSQSLKTLLNPTHVACTCWDTGTCSLMELKRAKPIALVATLCVAAIISSPETLELFLRRKHLNLGPGSWFWKSRC